MNNWNMLIKEARRGRPVRSDSRKVEPGDIFVALAGTRDDGSRYIPQALDRGASFVVAVKSDQSRQMDQRQILHPHPHKALGELARAYFGTDRLKLKIIGITGTNGKTTTSYILEHLLTRNGFSTGVLGTLNYRWPGTEIRAGTTTPECLELHRMLACMDNEGVQYVCTEVSSHALDQQRTAGIDFHTAVFTNLSRDHLDYHLDMQDYFLAKKKLFSARSTENFLGSALNMDDQYGRILAREAPKPLGYGLNKVFAPSLGGKLIQSNARGVSLECTYQDNVWTLKSSLSGRHNALNLLAAQGAGLCLGLEPRHFECLEDLGPVPGRLEKVKNPGDLHVFVDYAHTPDALDNVCQALKELDFDGLLVLFGCGGDRDRGKRPHMGRAAARHADLIVLTSDNPRFEEPESIIQGILPGLKDHPYVHIEPDRRKAIRTALSLLRPGQALLVAGKGHEDYQEIKGVRQDFSDVEEIRKALEEMSLQKSAVRIREVQAG